MNRSVFPAALRRSFLAASLLLLAACGDDGGSSPTATPDGSAEASGDTGSTVEDTDDSPDTRDASDTATDTRDASDTAADTRDAGDTAADTADAADTVDAGRIPGTVPLSNYIGCDSDDECPVGTGNCVTAVAFNRTANGSASRVTIAELDPTWTRSGVCSRVCSDQVDACAELRLPGAPDEAYSCQVVAVGAPPYALDGSGALPDPATLDPLEQTKGLPFAALCLPPFRVTTGFGPDFCEPCSETNACEPGSACWSDAPFATEPSTTGACLTACGGADGTCPIGFDCTTLDPSAGSVLGGAAEGTFCLPKAATCGACRDADGDGFGTGLCDGNNATPHDCDDAVETSWFDAADMGHAFTASCGETLDANCNGVGDLYDQIGTLDFGATHCTACADSCGGRVTNGDRICEGGALAPRCGVRCDSDNVVDCDGDPATGCEVARTDASRLYYADCDGDGVPQAGEPLFDCAGSGEVTIEVGGVACAGVAETDILVGTDGLVFDCDDADSANTPGGDEVCDGQDNDCNGVVDDTAILRGANLRCTATAPDVFGTCRSNGTWTCEPSAVGTGAGGETCVPATESAEVCDGLDNDCDGTVDDFEPVPGVTPPAGAVGSGCDVGPGSTAVGICRSRATNICLAGAIVCQPAQPEATDLPGDGVGDAFDANCDGWEGDMSRSIFVSTLGAAGGDGTLARPFATIGQALALKNVIASKNQIYISQGTFAVANGFTIGDGDVGAVIIGGYGIDPVSRAFTGPTGGTTLSFGTGTNTICAAGASPCPSASTSDFESALTVRNPSGVLLKNLTISVAKPPVNFGHIVGLACYGGLTGCGGLKLQGMSFDLTGADGSDAADQPAAADGAAGVNGNYATGNWAIRVVGANTGATASAARVVAGASACGVPGGNGGGVSWSISTSGLVTSLFQIPGTDSIRYSDPSIDGDAFASAAAGLSAEISSYTAVAGLTPTYDGRPGTNATRQALGGNFGDSRAAFGIGDGTAGQPGQAGLGGSGGGYRRQTSRIDVFNGVDGTLEAAGGGAGGGGGCGGNGGGAGRAGGSVVGIFWDSLTAPLAADFQVSFSLQPGKGGDGGAGGAGGTGGAQSALKASTIAGWGQAGGIGGPGGHGSGGGAGGSGGNGWAVNVARRDTVSFDGLMSFVSPSAITHDRIPSGGVGNRLPRLYRYATIAGNDPVTMTPDPASPNGADANPGTEVTRNDVFAPPSAGFRLSTCWIDKLGDASSCFASCPAGFHADPANAARCAPDRIACDGPQLGANGERASIAAQVWNGTNYGQCTNYGCVDPTSILAAVPATIGGPFCFAPVTDCNADGGFGTQASLSGETYTACELDGCYDANSSVVGNTCLCNAGFHDEGGVCISDLRECRFSFGEFLPELGYHSAYGSFGEERWNGTGYGACTFSRCEDPAGIVSGTTCLPPTRTCSTATGTGEQYKYQNNINYTGCWLTACNPGNLPQAPDIDPLAEGCSYPDGTTCVPAYGECGNTRGQPCTTNTECGIHSICFQFDGPLFHTCANQTDRLRYYLESILYN